MTNLFSTTRKYSQGICGNGVASSLMAVVLPGAVDGDHGDDDVGEDDDDRVYEDA